jgi:UPF0755 protein
LHRPFRDYESAEKVFVVETGQSARGIFERLTTEGVLQHPLLTRVYFTYVLDSPSLQAGEYRFGKPLTAVETIDKLVRGDVILYDVTLIEGLTLDETASHLAEQGFGSLETFLYLMRSPELIRDLDPRAANLEGYLFPETYAFSRSATEANIVSTLITTFRQRYEQQVRPALTLADTITDPRRLVTLASIVEKEALLDDERPTIAGVYSNRLERGIALYADPTVIYALKRLERWDGNLRRADLQIDDPYNTYRYPDLPPGPICSPGLSSLMAAAQPADVPYLYFVSRNDGTHAFASTLTEHNRNVEKFQRQYWRKRWAEGRQKIESGAKKR